MLHELHLQIQTDEEGIDVDSVCDMIMQIPYVYSVDVLDETPELGWVEKSIIALLLTVVFYLGWQLLRAM